MVRARDMVRARVMVGLQLLLGKRSPAVSISYPSHLIHAVDPMVGVKCSA